MTRRKSDSKRQRVLILHTGGTIGMEGYPDSALAAHPSALSLPELSAKAMEERLLNRVPELKQLADCKVDIILNRDSSHIGPDEWLLIAEHIRENWKNYDGVVLLHGTDTLAFTACALSFLLRPCRIPVVITGAQRPLSALRTDARNNLISAVEIAAHGPRQSVNQVSVFFSERLFQGNRVRKRSSIDFSAFESPYFPPLARVGTTIRYTKSTIKPLKGVKKLLPVFDRKVFLCQLSPAFPSAAVEMLLPEIHGIVLIVFASGTAPTHDPDFNKFLAAVKRRGIPMTLATETSVQDPNSEKPLMRYEAGSELLNAGGLWAGSMTPECAFVKTSILLGQTGPNLREFTRLWKQDLAGEGT